MALHSEIEAGVINSLMCLKCCDFEDKYGARTSLALMNTVTTPPFAGELIVIIKK
jgi:hypothetical protein